MSEKLKINELKKKKKYHKKRAFFYNEKIKQLEKSNIRIGFKWYD